MIAGIPAYLLVTPIAHDFLSANRVPIFIMAMVMAAMLGVIASRSELLKKLCFVGFMAGLVFPFFDISFLVDTKIVGVATARGLYVTAADLFALALAIAMLLGHENRRLVGKFPGLIPYLMYTAVAALSIVNMGTNIVSGFQHPTYVYGFFELFNVVKCLAVFWLMVNYLRGEKEIWLAITLMVGAVFLEAGWAVFAQYRLHIYGRSAGTLGHPNSLAMFVGLILPVILVLMLSTKSGGLTPWILAVVFLAGVTLMLKTVSRGGMIAMIVSCTLALALLAFKVRRLHAMRVAALVLVIGLGGAGMTYKFWNQIAARFGTTTLESEKSNISRMLMYESGIAIWLKNPVLGNGFNSFPIEIAVNPGELGHATEQHNLYLLTLCETGVVGLFVLLLVFARVFQIAIRLIRQKISPGMRILAIGLMCGMLHVVIESAFEFVFRIVFISYMFWMYAAMIVACWYMLKDQAARIQMARMAFAKRMAAADRTPGRVHQFNASAKR